MLAKVWKKVLLVICIIACLYNVMHKLVSRVSLEVQLKSVQNQSGFIDMIEHDKDKNDTTQNSSVENKSTRERQERDNATKNNTTVVIY